MRNPLALLPLLLAACVSGDDSSGNPQGSLGGPCFSNDTCNAGLVCVVESGSAKCEQSDATVQDAPADQSTNDAPAEASADAGADAPLEPCDAAAQAPCPTKTGCLTGCCASEGVCALSGKCNDLSTPWACVTTAGCGDAGALCCIGITIKDAGTCPPVAVSTQSACHAGGVCTAGQNALCTGNADCPPSAPTCTTVLVSGMSTPIGVCK